MNEMCQTFHILFSLTSYPPNPVASPFASPVRVTGKATGCHSYPNATAMMNCCFSLLLVYHLHLVACWMIASVAPMIPLPHTGTGGSPRYTLLDPTQTPTLSPCRALAVFSVLSCFTDQLRFLSQSQSGSGSPVKPQFGKDVFKTHRQEACNYCMGFSPHGAFS